MTETPTQPSKIILLVANTEGAGVNIRAATDDPESIKVWEDGTEMVVVGQNVPGARFDSVRTCKTRTETSGPSLQSSWIRS